jgi:Ni/Co efflux regulator RcnB
MHHMTLHASRVLVLTFVAACMAAPAIAEKPEGAGDGKPGRSAKPDKRSQAAQGKGGSGGPPGSQVAPRDKTGAVARAPVAGVSVTVGGYFADTHRTVVRDYYGTQLRAGKCPPGLAKKGNGCQPPGQAKKWALGRPLPRDVIYYNVPPAIAVELGVPPAGYRFVRVAADILLIAIGTGMVIDAIEDLAR